MGQANTSEEEQLRDEYLWMKWGKASPAEQEESRQQEGLPKGYYKELEKKMKKRRKDAIKKWEDEERKREVEKRKHEDEKRKHEDEERKRTVPYLTYKAKVGALEDCIENIFQLLSETQPEACCEKVKRVKDYIRATCPPKGREKKQYTKEDKAQFDQWRQQMFESQRREKMREKMRE